MSGNKNPDVSVMSKCWKGTRTLSCMNTLLCYCGFKHSSGSDWSRVLENTLYVVFKDRCICMNMFCRWAVPSWPSFPSFLTSSLSPPLLSPLCISRIPAHLSSFFTGLTTFCTSPLFRVSPFLSPDTNFHTPIQGNVRNASVPAASCCCCTNGRNCVAWGARVFLQGPWMDGWMDTDIEWLMKKWGRVDPTLNGSIPAPRVNKDVLIQQRTSAFSCWVFPNIPQMSKNKNQLSTAGLQKCYSVNETFPLMKPCLVKVQLAQPQIQTCLRPPPAWDGEQIYHLHGWLTWLN